MNATNDLRFKDLKYIIFKISDDKKEIVVEDSSTDTDYEVFRTKLVEAKDSKGKPAPRYALYDGEFDLGSEGIRFVFISSPFATNSRIIYIYIYIRISDTPSFNHIQKKDHFHLLGSQRHTNLRKYPPLKLLHSPPLPLPLPQGQTEKQSAN